MTEKTSLEQDKQRSELLKKQLTQLNEDYEAMKKNKEQWKKQLDAHFQDLERKIEASKQFIASEAKRTNDTLLAFQHKFHHELTAVKTQLQQNIDTLQAETHKDMTQRQAQIKQLNDDLTRESKDRENHVEETAKTLGQRIDKTSEAIEKQKEARIASEEQNMGKINEQLFKLQQQLKQEKNDRILKVSELSQKTERELDSQRKFNQSAQQKSYADFKNSLGQLRAEMESRFSAKDEIINSISKIVKTLQDTLRHPQ